MKRKHLLFIGIIFVIIAACALLTACNESGKSKIIAVETGKIDGDIISLEVGTTVKTLDMAKVISVSKGASFTVSEDEEGSLVIPDKVLNLEDGENEFYVIVKSGKNKKTYELNIWKNFYTSVYYYIDGELFDRQDNVLSHTYLEDFRHPEELTYQREFLGWDCEGYYIEEKSKVFNARIRYKEFFIRLDADGGECSADAASVALGADFKLPVPTKKGHSFVGWEYNGRRLTYEDGKSCLDCWDYNGNLTVKAHWRVNSYEVLFVSNMNDVNSHLSGTYEYGKQHTVNYGKLKKLGYRFLGWYRNGVKLGDGYELTFTPEENMQIEKRWEYDTSLDIFDYDTSYNGLIITNIKTKNITSLIIPQGIYEIKEGALSGLSNLEELTIPFVGVDGSMLYDGMLGSVFGTERYDNSIEIKQTYDHSSTLGGRYYYVPQSLRKVTVMTDKTFLCEGAFENFSMLTEVCLNKSVTNIYAYAFSGCTALEKITLGGSVKSVGAGAFLNCTSLAAVEMTDSIKYVGKRAFEGTAWLDGKEDGVVYVGKALYEFKGTVAQNSVIVIKNDTVYVAENAFANCGASFAVYIPKSVVSMGANVFSGCSDISIACEALVKPNDWNANWQGDVENPDVNWNIPLDSFEES